MSNHWIWPAPPASGITPMREPNSGFHWYGITPLAGSWMYLIARSRSKTTGMSQKTASVSVIWKSWIIVLRGRSTGSFVAHRAVGFDDVVRQERRGEPVAERMHAAGGGIDLRVRGERAGERAAVV